MTEPSPAQAEAADVARYMQLIAAAAAMKEQALRRVTTTQREFQEINGRRLLIVKELAAIAGRQSKRKAARRERAAAARVQWPEVKAGYDAVALRMADVTRGIENLQAACRAAAQDYERTEEGRAMARHILERLEKIMRGGSTGPSP